MHDIAQKKWVENIWIVRSSDEVRKVSFNLYSDLHIKAAQSHENGETKHSHNSEHLVHYTF